MTNEPKTNEPDDSPVPTIMAAPPASMDSDGSGEPDTMPEDTNLDHGKGASNPNSTLQLLGAGTKYK